MNPKMKGLLKGCALLGLARLHEQTGRTLQAYLIFWFAGSERPELAKRLEEFSDDVDFDRTMGRQMAEIARSLVSDPKIIMLDEPFAGIDPVTVQNIQSIIRDLCAAGISILMKVMNF